MDPTLTTMLAFIDADSIPGAVRDELSAVATRLSRQALEPVEVFYVDQTQPTDGEDEPIETVGIAARLPKLASTRAEDERCLASIKQILEALCEWSRTSGVELEVEWDEQYVGVIQHGKADRGIREVLIGEWERHLAKGGQKPR